MDDRVRGLAQPLWESAARPYGMAMDFWLMAEQMVLEAAAATSRIQAGMFAVPPLPDAVEGLPESVPVARVRELARCMWEAAGRQYGMAQDFWLAAEKHVLAMVRASASLTDAKQETDRLAAELAKLPPESYLERVRLLAYFTWEASGRRYGEALDYWLRAEQQILNLMSAAVETPSGGAVAASSPRTLPAMVVDSSPAAGNGSAALARPAERAEGPAARTPARPRRPAGAKARA